MRQELDIYQNGITLLGEKKLSSLILSKVNVSSEKVFLNSERGEV